MKQHPIRCIAGLVIFESSAGLGDNRGVGYVTAGNDVLVVKLFLLSADQVGMPFQFSLFDGCRGRDDYSSPSCSTR